MFDAGFTELLLIAVVGLVVVGPERLPGFARTVGKYFGKLRRFMSDVKADVETELRADELRQVVKQQQNEFQSFQKEIEKSTDIDLSNEKSSDNLKESKPKSTTTKATNV